MLTFASRFFAYWLTLCRLHLGSVSPVVSLWISIEGFLSFEGEEVIFSQVADEACQIYHPSFHRTYESGNKPERDAVTIFHGLDWSRDYVVVQIAPYVNRLVVKLYFAHFCDGHSTMKGHKKIIGALLLLCAAFSTCLSPLALSRWLDNMLLWCVDHSAGIKNSVR